MVNSASGCGRDYIPSWPSWTAGVGAEVMAGTGLGATRLADLVGFHLFGHGSLTPFGMARGRHGTSCSAAMRTSSEYRRVPCSNSQAIGRITVPQLYRSRLTSLAVREAARCNTFHTVE